MEDAKIVQLYLDRDEQAIPETANKYGNYCTSIAKNILGNREDAEECVNHTYLNTWNTIPPHKPKMLSTFLGKIVRNLAFNRYKYNTAEKRGGGETAVILDELSECVSGREDVEKAYEQKELAAVINDFLGTLPTEKRNIFVRRYWYAEDISDLATRFGMSYPAISMTLKRLRGKLREYLIERGYEV
ncbi:MAG: sigma-70 family RNA polymerase sigma factor [Clostridia bacterium]|nr:sigma-70 family RNA polymerase sigma factor [Clostridia bacterium]